MSWPHVQNIRDKFLFWFSLQSCCEGPKKFYSFHLHGCTTCTKKKKDIFLVFKFDQVFHEFIAFLSWPFFFLCFLITSSLVMKKQESCTQNVRRNCLLHEYL